MTTVRGIKNGECLRLTDDLPVECYSPSGAYEDVNEACEKWLLENDPHYKRLPTWNVKRTNSLPPTFPV